MPWNPPSHKLTFLSSINPSFKFPASAFREIQCIKGELLMMLGQFRSFYAILASKGNPTVSLTLDSIDN
jgi:hypothetical protein